MLLVEDGVSLSGHDRSLDLAGLLAGAPRGPARAGVLVKETGERIAVYRKPSIPLHELADLLSDGVPRSTFMKEGRKLYRSGQVPAKVAEKWRYLNGREREGVDREWWAANGLALAVSADAKELTAQTRASCGSKTWEWEFRDVGGEVRRVWFQYRCNSHRCSFCAPGVGDAVRDRIVAQCERDQAAGRAPWVFLTVSVDRSRYRFEVQAQRDLLERFKRFRRLLRDRFGKDLASFVAVEMHRQGWPHAHAVLRSETLAAAMLADAKCASWAELCEKTRASEAREGKRHPCPFARLRRELNVMAVKAGLGEMGFYLAPVLGSPQDLAAYMTKDQTKASKSTVGHELTKDTQIGELPRNFRRFRASGIRGDGEAQSFFLDELPDEDSGNETLHMALIRSRPEPVYLAASEAGILLCEELYVTNYTEGAPEGALSLVRFAEGEDIPAD